MNWFQPGKRIAVLFWLSLGVFTALPVHAQPTISKLSYLDKQYMSQQREILADLVASNFGRQFHGARDNDLELLQRLLDQNLVRPEQTRELQAMGVIMGDLLVADLKLHWVIYEDRQGRSRAIRDGTSDTYLFPITMISRRWEVGNDTPVAKIYQKARDIVIGSRPGLPFQ